jgi:type II secretory pathway pseudopilin PulG
MRRAYTLVELTIILVVLVLMAALVVPNLLSMLRSRSIFAEEQAVLRAPLTARTLARRSKVAVALKLQGNAIVIEKHKDDNSDEEVKRVPLDSLRVRSTHKNGNAEDQGTWKWTVYPDGTSDTGGIEFAEGAVKKSLALSANADARWVDGDLPNTSDDTWQAGQLQTRN